MSTPEVRVSSRVGIGNGIPVTARRPILTRVKTICTERERESKRGTQGRGEGRGEVEQKNGRKEGRNGKRKEGRKEEEMQCRREYLKNRGDLG